MKYMWTYSKYPVLQAATNQKHPERSREETSTRAAVLKLERSRDAAQAMKDHEAAKRETLAKTARLRAERLARDAKAAAETKPLGTAKGAHKK